MSIDTVKVGQVWRDKDKRRNTVIEIIAVGKGPFEGEVTGLVVGTETEKAYKVERLLKRWEFVEEKSTEISLSEAAELVRQGSAELIADLGGSKTVVSVPERLRPKQATYMLKLVSPEVPSYYVRTTKKMIEGYGHPLDPWGNKMEEA